MQSTTIPFPKTLISLGVTLILLTLGGCSSDSASDSANAIPGPPTGAQPGAAISSGRTGPPAGAQPGAADDTGAQ